MFLKNMVNFKVIFSFFEKKSTILARQKSLVVYVIINQFKPIRAKGFLKGVHLHIQNFITVYVRKD